MKKKYEQDVVDMQTLAANNDDGMFPMIFNFKYKMSVGLLACPAQLTPFLYDKIHCDVF